MLTFTARFVFSAGNFSGWFYGFSKACGSVRA
jgi:hypothetical protein